MLGGLPVIRRLLCRLLCWLFGHRAEDGCVVEGRCARCGAFIILDVVRGRLRWVEPKLPRRGGGW